MRPGVSSGVEMQGFSSIEEVRQALVAESYIAERGLATTLHLALRMGRPVFLEGEAGVGKTAVAEVLSRVLHAPLIRLQCYEGLDVSSAVYDWNYARQMLEIRLLEASGAVDRQKATREVFSREFMIRRPLLNAIDFDGAVPPVLLIDELDRADEEFEAYLLELLSEFQVTIPEIGTIKAPAPPVIVITSNRTREIHDALKRRCLYYWIDFPDRTKELQILRSRIPGVDAALASQVVAFVQELRGADLYKLPGVAETLDWCQALQELSCQRLDDDTIDDTLGILLKYHDDIGKVKGEGTRRLLAAVDRHA